MLVRPMSACLLNTFRSGPVEKILALNKSSARPSYSLIGGKSNVGESPEETCARETLEETGLIINPNDLQLIYATTARHYFAFVFAPKQPFDLTVELRNSEEGEVTWAYWNHLTYASTSSYWKFNLALKEAWHHYLNNP